MLVTIVLSVWILMLFVVIRQQHKIIKEGFEVLEEYKKALLLLAEQNANLRSRKEWE